MALYEFKERRSSGTPPEGSPPRWPVPAAVLLILVAAFIQALGIPHAIECRLAAGIGMHPKEASGTILLSLPSSSGLCDPMDLALALRGLSMLHPAVILIPSVIENTPEQAGMIESVKSRLRERRIPVIEIGPDLPETRYHPLPLCRYSLCASSEIPSLTGAAPADGSLRFSTAGREARGILPLLAQTSTGDPVGSIWWDGVMANQPNAPVWLFMDRWLLLPDHDVLRIDRGCVSMETAIPPQVVALEDFLLRMEEHERGTLSPGFDARWDRAVVVVASADKSPQVASLGALRELTQWPSLSVTTQLLSAILLSALTALSFLTRGRLRIAIVLLVILGVSSAAVWILLGGIIPPLLPWTLAGLLTALAPLVPGCHPNLSATI